MLRLRLGLVLMLLVAFVGVACSQPAPAPAVKPAAPTPAPTKVYKLIYSDGFARGSSVFVNAVNEWIKPLEAKSGGRLQFEVHGAGELVGGVDLFKALTTGSVDAGGDAWIWHTGTFPEADVHWLPFLYDSIAQNAAAFYEVQLPIFNKVLRKHNQIALAITAPPSEQTLFTRKPVRKMEELKGMKLRAAGTAQSVLYAELGAAGVMIPLSETVPALATGAVDGLLWNQPIAYDFSVWGVAPYAIRQPILIGACEMVFNLDSWNKLPTDLQQLILDHSRWFNHRQGTVLGPSETEVFRKRNAEKGVTYYTLPDDELQRFREKGTNVWGWFAKQSADCKELLERTRAFLGK